MWLMDHQMNMNLNDAFGEYYVRLPLSKSPKIVCGNAIQLSWDDILPRTECRYILGNPPFVGKKEQTAEQKADMDILFGKVKGAGVLDYVSCWYAKAAEYVRGTKIVSAFVSTNSITQGEQVGVLWGELFGRFALTIHLRTAPLPGKARRRVRHMCMWSSSDSRRVIPPSVFSLSMKAPKENRTHIQPRTLTDTLLMPPACAC